MLVGNGDGGKQVWGDAVIAFFIDADNFSSTAWIDEACERLTAEYGPIDVRRAYGEEGKLRPLQAVMQKLAIRPFTNQPLSKNTTDMALAVDVMELACQAIKPTLVAIASGDGDFVPLVVRLRERGIKVVCVSERSKLTGDAAAAYNALILVGDTAEEPVKTPPDKAPNVAKQKAVQQAVVAKKAPAKKAAAKKAAPAAPAKKATSKKGVVQNPTLEQVLDAVPGLRSGQYCQLDKVSEALHAEKLLGKSATFSKFIRKFGTAFELQTKKTPHQVRYVLP